MKFAWLACATFFCAAVAAQPVPAPPAFRAKASVLLDFESGQVITGTNTEAPVEPASLTKLMTLYIAFDQMRTGKLKLSDEVLVSEHAWRSEGSRSFMEVGKRVPVDALVHGIIIQSGNDASIALAEHIAGTETVFADLMNRYATRLGLTHSHFTNATGLPDPALHTSALDVARLSRALIRDFPDQYPWFALKEYSYNNILQHNRNRLLWRDPSVDGLKTGHTESAGYSLAASSMRDGRRLIAVVIGTESEANRADACLALLNYGFSFYETVTAVAAQSPVTVIRPWKGTEIELALGVRESLRVTVPRGQAARIQVTPDAPGQVFAPVSAGQELGRVTVSLDGKVLRQAPLLALAALPEGGLWRRWSDEVRLILGLSP